MSKLASGNDTTHDAIDRMTVDQLKELIVTTWGLGSMTQLRTTRKPDLVRQAHAWLSLAEAKDAPTPFPVAPEATAGASDDYAPRDEPTDDERARFYAEHGTTPDEPGTDLEVAAPEAGTVPSQSKWQQIMDIAETVAMANLAPADLRGKGNIGNARLVLLAAHDLGIPITQAIQKLAPVNGRLVMSAELMAALIRRDGHLLSVPAADWSGVTVHGKRADTGEEQSVTFTLEDAKRAELISGFADDGSPIARSNNGSPLPWQLYPEDLCYARALSRLGRRLFPDCLGGISYTPEELGETGEYDAGASFGAPAPVQSSRPEANQTIEEQRAALGVRIAALPEDLQGLLKDEWKRRNLPTLKSAPVGVIRTIRNLVEHAEADVAAAAPQPDAPDDQGDPIDDAELVHDDDTPAESTVEQVAADLGASVEANPICEACTLPIAPGLADNGTGETVTQPVEVEGKSYHATCAPF